MKMIVAHGHDRVIGIKNKLPWRLPPDLKHFSKQTKSCGTVLCGRKTFDSIGGYLPERQFIVLSRDHVSEKGEVVVRNMTDAISLASSVECMIIGGAEIYAKMIHLCEELLITRIDVSVPGGDAFFPEYTTHFHLESVLSQDVYEGMGFSIERWRRKTP